MCQALGLVLLCKLLNLTLIATWKLGIIIPEHLWICFIFIYILHPVLLLKIDAICMRTSPN